VTSITDAQAGQLITDAIEKYTRAGAIYSRMSKMPALRNSDYNALDCEARALVADADRDHARYRDWKVQRDAEARTAAIVAEWAEDTEFLREAELNEDGK